MSREYKKLIHGIQALRRKVELSCCPVLGGAGVKSFCYPHQLYIVNRVLTHTRIRHLLADEVGLGKTLEALMIMNALRLRNGGQLRVSIVVGSEERAKQWRTEIRGRFPFPFWKNSVYEDYPNWLINGDVFFKVSGDKDWSENDFEKLDDFTIFHSQNFEELKEYLEPEYCGLLILDEFHGFSDTLKNFLTSRSAEYKNILVLSATPLLGEEKDRRQLLEILSPELAELSELQGEPPRLEPVQTQILRSRRRDFPKALPQRAPKIIRIEPLENDELRFKKSRKLMQLMVDESLVNEENAVLFIRRASIGGQTLVDRIDEYRPRYEKYAEQLTDIRQYCSAEQGDSRFDALMEYLVHFFTESARRKLIIAAQDNPTIDYLAKQIERCLPEAGPFGQREKVKILQFRQERNRQDENEVDDDNTDDLTEIREKNKGIVERFWTGPEQILIAHNDARESFNLQIADALVFYSLPWNPAEMEQWLGRISRLGLRKMKTVEIIALVQRGMIDERIADLYESLNMFQKPLDLEKNEKILDAKSTEIRRAVLGSNDIHEGGDVITEADNVHMHIVPPDAAHLLYDKVQYAVEPMIKTIDNGNDANTIPKEEALANWLDKLQEHQYCSLQTYHDDNYKGRPNPEYYRFRVIDKHKNCPFPVPALENDPLSKIPYVLKRVHIQMPPRDFVPIFRWEKDEKQRYEVPLQFFNFGSLLHDKLVEYAASFLDPLKTTKLLHVNATFRRDQFIHDPDAENGRYLVSIAAVTRRHTSHDALVEKLLEGCEKNTNKTQEEMRQSESQRLKNGLEADDRFVDELFPGSLEIRGFVWTDNKWSRMKDISAAYDFLTCLPEKVENIDVQSTADDLREKLLAFMKKPVAERWRNASAEKVEERIKTLERETQVREEVLRIKIENLRKRIEEETNMQVIRMNYQPEKNRLEEQLSLVRRQLNLRQRFLSESKAATADSEIESQVTVSFNIQITE